MAWICLPAKAHEFWIDPVDHTVAPGETIEAFLRVGEQYKGNATPYLPNSFHRFDYAFEGKLGRVNGRVGDQPAMLLRVPADGLLVAIHQTKDQFVTWNTWDKFVNFLEHKDLTWGLAEHDARGLPREDVRERYSRYAKSLIAVGSGAGDDVVTGMETEIVALENPYTGRMSDGLDIRALYQGKALADAQIEVFRKARDGSVVVSFERTNSAGKATIPVEPGHRYMLDTVVLRPLQVQNDRDASWESLWANLTFEVPAR